MGTLHRNGSDFVIQSSHGTLEIKSVDLGFLRDFGKTNQELVYTILGELGREHIEKVGGWIDEVNPRPRFAVMSSGESASGPNADDEEPIYTVVDFFKPNFLHFIPPDITVFLDNRVGPWDCQWECDPEVLKFIVDKADYTLYEIQIHGFLHLLGNPNILLDSLSSDVRDVLDKRVASLQYELECLRYSRKLWQSTMLPKLDEPNRPSMRRMPAQDSPGRGLNQDSSNLIRFAHVMLMAQYMVFTFYKYRMKPSEHQYDLRILNFGILPDKDEVCWGRVCAHHFSINANVARGAQVKIADVVAFFQLLFLMHCIA